MQNKRIYYFSVEGQTEKEYLKWFENQINQNISEDKEIEFNIVISNHPLKRIKTIPKDQLNDLYHFCDYESNDSYHQENFRRVIDELTKAKNNNFINNYYLCYSNYTFDLWLILHKIDLYSSSSHRNNYIRVINHTFKTSFRGMHEFKRKENLRKVLKQLSLEDVKKAITREKKIYEHNKLNGYQEINYKGYTYFRENPSLSLGFCFEKILKENGLL